jgi:hypothetical protein
MVFRNVGTIYQTTYRSPEDRQDVQMEAVVFIL